MTDDRGNILHKKEKYPLSPKDLCTIELLPELCESGIYSFKIEGRMKKPEYTAGVVSVYRKYLDKYLSGEKSGNPHEALFWRKMDTRAIRSGSYKLIITRGVDSVLYNMDQDVEEMHDLLSSEPEKARELMEQLSEWEQACCKDPLWIEEGWAEITNGLHERLMKNEIRTAQDL